jgi:hypothetical protein
MSSLTHFLEIKTKQQITRIVSLKSLFLWQKFGFPRLFPYKKISRYWLGGYACAVWPIVRVTCFGLSELSVYTSSVSRPTEHRVYLKVEDRESRVESKSRESTAKSRESTAKSRESIAKSRESIAKSPIVRQMSSFQSNWHINDKRILF